MESEGRLMSMLTGYAAQFIGHAVEKSVPVLVKHPIQAKGPEGRSL